LAADYHPDKQVVHTAMTTGGFEEEQVPKLLLALDNRKLEDVMRPLGREIYSTQKQVTRRPAQYDPDGVFLDPVVSQRWQDADISAPLVCYRPVANNCLSGIGLYRRFNSAPFSQRQVKIAHIILTEVAWLHEQGWPWESALQVPALPKRCRMALNLLLEGLSRKQLAERMEISTHTVNEYVKHVYEFYDVHSHAELLNRFRVGDGGQLG
jgi:DNA-binding CsgD family transcriptional regulator